MKYHKTCIFWRGGHCTNGEEKCEYIHGYVLKDGSCTDKRCFHNGVSGEKREMPRHRSRSPRRSPYGYRSSKYRRSRSRSPYRGYRSRSRSPRRRPHTRSRSPYRRNHSRSRSPYSRQNHSRSRSPGTRSTYRSSSRKRSKSRSRTRDYKSPSHRFDPSRLTPGRFTPDKPASGGLHLGLDKPSYNNGTSYHNDDKQKHSSHTEVNIAGSSQSLGSISNKPVETVKDVPFPLSADNEKKDSSINDAILHKNLMDTIYKLDPSNKLTPAQARQFLSTLPKDIIEKLSGKDLSGMSANDEPEKQKPSQMKEQRPSSAALAPNPQTSMVSESSKKIPKFGEENRNIIAAYSTQKELEVSHTPPVVPRQEIPLNVAPEPKKKKKEKTEKKRKRRASTSSSGSSSRSRSRSVSEDENSKSDELLTKKRSILAKVWALMEQKKKLDAKREETINNHNGDQQSLEDILQDNDNLSQEIDKQIYVLNEMVQAINENLGMGILENHQQEFFMFSNLLKDDSEIPGLKKNSKQSKIMSLPLAEKLKLVSKVFKKDEPSSSIAKSSLKEDKKQSSKIRHSPVFTAKRSLSPKKSKRSSRERSPKKFKCSPKRYSSENSVRKNEDKKQYSIEKSVRKYEDKKQTRDVVKNIAASNLDDIDYAPSPALKPNVKYIDQGMHWCQLCNQFCDSIAQFVAHLQSFDHLEQLSRDKKTWLPKPIIPPKEKPRPGAPVITIPLQGVEFLRSTTGFYCSLCETFSTTTAEATEHAETKIHVSKYKDYLSKNPMYETNYIKEKMSAYAKFVVDKEKKKNVHQFFCQRGEQNPPLTKKIPSNETNESYPSDCIDLTENENIESECNKNVKHDNDVASRRQSKLESLKKDIIGLETYTFPSDKPKEEEIGLKTNTYPTDKPKEEKIVKQREIVQEFEKQQTKVQSKNTFNVMIGKMPFLKKSKTISKHKEDTSVKGKDNKVANQSIKDFVPYNKRNNNDAPGLMLPQFQLISQYPVLKKDENQGKTYISQYPVQKKVENQGKTYIFPIISQSSNKNPSKISSNLDTSVSENINSEQVKINSNLIEILPTETRESSTKSTILSHKANKTPEKSLPLPVSNQKTPLKPKSLTNYLSVSISDPVDVSLKSKSLANYLSASKSIPLDTALKSKSLANYLSTSKSNTVDNILKSKSLTNYLSSSNSQTNDHSVSKSDPINSPAPVTAWSANNFSNSVGMSSNTSVTSLNQSHCFSTGQSISSQYANNITNSSNNSVSNPYISNNSVTFPYSSQNTVSYPYSSHSNAPYPHAQTYNVESSLNAITSSIPLPNMTYSNQEKSFENVHAHTSISYAQSINEYQIQEASSCNSERQIPLKSVESSLSKEFSLSEKCPTQEASTHDATTFEGKKESSFDDDQILEGLQLLVGADDDSE